MVEIYLRFSEQSTLDRFAHEGWGLAEPSGVQMIGAESRLVLPPPHRDQGAFEMEAVIWPNSFPSKRDRMIRILVNRYLVFETKLDRGMKLYCQIPEGVIRCEENVEVLIEHPDASPPANLKNEANLPDITGSVWSLSLVGLFPLPQIRQPTKREPTFVIRAQGNIGNRMIQHMVALAVQAASPKARLAGTRVEEWGMAAVEDDGQWADLALTEEQHIDIRNVAEMLNDGTFGKIVYRGYGQRMENFLPREAYASVFVTDEPNILSYDENYLVINVRTGDIVSGGYPPYVLLPLDFYRELIARTGLAPVFLGQLEPNAYTLALREAFPDAIFHNSQGPLRDFETVRRATNIVVAVSTFSWLAAWLSNATQIFLPVNGIFNPLQFPKVDLLPIDDPRYLFFLFPINHAAEDFVAAHAEIDGKWLEVSSAKLPHALGRTTTR